MTTAVVLVIISGLALIAGIAWFFWGPRRGGYRTAVTSSGYQEARMLMKGGCTPDVIVVRHARASQLPPRGERRLLGDGDLRDFGKSTKLPEGETVAVEFVPKKPGEYEFACQMCSCSCSGDS